LTYYETSSKKLGSPIAATVNIAAFQTMAPSQMLDGLRSFLGKTVFPYLTREKNYVTVNGT